MSGLENNRARQFFCADAVTITENQHIVMLKTSPLTACSPNDVLSAGRNLQMDRDNWRETPSVIDSWFAS